MRVCVCGIRFRLSGKNFTFGSFAVTIGEERRSRRQKKHLKQFFIYKHRTSICGIITGKIIEEQKRRRKAKPNHR